MRTDKARKATKEKWIIRAGMLNLFALGCLLPLYWHVTRDARHLAACEQVVVLVQKGTLQADASGDILLPKEWSWLTANGHVYRTYNKKSGVVLLFPTDAYEYRVGWGDGTSATARDIAGYVYCPGSLPKVGWFSFNGINDVSTWNQYAAVRTHWYYVEPFYSD